LLLITFETLFTILKQLQCKELSRFFSLLGNPQTPEIRKKSRTDSIRQEANTYICKLKLILHMFDQAAVHMLLQL
jgi:hypothetical protein